LHELAEAYELLRTSAGVEANYPYLGTQRKYNDHSPSANSETPIQQPKEAGVHFAHSQFPLGTKEPLKSPQSNNWFEGRMPIFVGVGVAFLVLVLGFFVFRAAKRQVDEMPIEGHSRSGPSSALPELQQVKSVKECLLFAADAKQKGDHKRAIEFYLKAQEIEPTNQDVAALLTDISSHLGHLHISSDPSGASAEVFRLEKPSTEGVPISLENARPFRSGATPFDFVGLPYDDYAVRITRRGYSKPEVAFFSVVGPAVQTEHFVMVRNKGKLSVNTQPSALPYVLSQLKPDTDDASFPEYVDKGSTPMNEKEFETGRYRLEIPALAYSKEVDLTVDKISVLDLTGTEISSTNSTLPADGRTGTSVSEPVRTTPPPTPVKLPVQTDRPEYRVGDSVVLTVLPPFEGFLRIVSEDVNGRTTQVFPNGFDQERPVPAGQPIKIPTNDTYDLRLELPAGVSQGRERVVAYLSDRPSSDSAARIFIADNPFPGLQGKADSAIIRGISGHAKQAAQGTVEYQVTP
jgi:hypothetical protein